MMTLETLKTPIPLEFNSKTNRRYLLSGVLVMTCRGTCAWINRSVMYALLTKHKLVQPLYNDGDTGKRSKEVRAYVIYILQSQTYYIISEKCFTEDCVLI